MRALIMAGGAGTRLNLGEKPLISLCGKPMIGYVIDAFSEAGFEPVVVGSQKTPMTMNWCRAHGITIYRSAGLGFIEDMIQAVKGLEEEGPVFVSVSDIPCITSDILSTVAAKHHDCGKDALSTWVPAHMVRSCRGGMPYREEIGGVESCPAGVNILRGDIIGKEQDEYPLLLEEPRLALNVNTREDLDRTISFLKSL